MSLDSKSPFDSPNTSSSPRPINAPTDSPQVGDLFAANKQISQQTLQMDRSVPSLGTPTVAGYKPSGRVGALGWPLLLLSLLLVPIVAAVLYENLWHLGNMVLLSTIALGGLVGGALYPAIRFGQVRNVFLAATVGALVGAATFSGAMALEAQSHRAELVAYDTAFLVKKYSLNPTQTRAKVEAHYTLPVLTQTYWTDRAASGMTVTSSRTHSSSQISGSLFWAVKGFEALFVVLASAGLAVYFATRRYSEVARQWYTTKLVGGVHPSHFKALLAAAQQGEWAQVGQLVGHSGTGKQEIALLHASYIPGQPGAIVSLTAKVSLNKNLQTVLERELTDAEMQTVWPAYPASPRS